MLDHITEPVKTGVDALSIVVILASLTELLPALAAGAAFVWTLLRIWEIVRVRGWWRIRDE